MPYIESLKQVKDIPPMSQPDDRRRRDKAVIGFSYGTS
jgi:hypothetical protein